MKLQSVTYSDIKTLLPLQRVNSLEFLCQLQMKYGDLVKVRLPFFTFYLISDGVLAKKILTEQQKNLCRPSFIKRTTERYGFGGILVSDGEPWQAARKRLGEIFHPKRIKEHNTTLRQHIHSTLETHLVTDTAVHPLKMLSKITLSVVFQFAYQFDVQQFDKDMVDLYHQLISQFFADLLSPVKLPLWLPTKKNIQITRSLRRYRENIQRLASKLSSASGLDEDKLSKEISDMFTAGMETTANTLAWCIYFLLEYPEQQAGLRAELQLNPADQKNKGLQNLILESIRLYPPGYQLNRQVASPFSIDGLRFKKNQQIIMFPFQIHRNPSYFPEPLIFNPKRFETKSPTVFMPFGFGAHFCIGSHFALIIAEHVLTYLLQHYKIERAYTTGITPLASLALTPSDDFKCVFTRISDNSKASDSDTNNLGS